jgi:glyoxylase-like metal-dependent hydrolase (beta-lactamase superfamily II)
MQVITNVFVLPSPIANVYLIVDPDGLTLIDAGLARSARKILRLITDLGYFSRQLRRVIVTHADGDHVGGLAAIKAASAARIYAHPIEAAAMAEGRMSRELKLRGPLKWLFALFYPWFQPKPTVVDETVAEGQVIPVLGGLRVVETPGHTPGHISLFAVSASVLFTGDSLVTEGDRLVLSREAYAWDPVQALESVKKQAALEARIVCPAHGPVVHNAVGKYPVV